MRKLTYFVACSMDGFISREDGGLSDFDMGGDHFNDLLREFPETIPGHLREELGVDSPNKHFDAILMGRKTYEVGLEYGVTNPYPHLDQYVVSGSLSANPDENVRLVNDDPIKLVQQLKSRSGKDIWLCGGGSLALSLLSEIDRFTPSVGIPRRLPRTSGGLSEQN